MPTIQENLNKWTAYDWTQHGNEWSSPWRGTEFLWWGTLLPRLHAFVPTDTILEIAPGYGRITQFLKDLCKQLIIVDITEHCIEACKRRFSSDSNIAYHINDGKSLEMISDSSIDFVISFDSLVHADADIIEVYLGQLSKKLKPNGVGFIHHSNVGACINPVMKLLPPYMRILKRDWRAQNMTAKLFELYCENAGLQCISQELINWGTNYPVPVDCFSLFTRKDSIWTRPNKVFANMSFTKETKYLAKLSEAYTTSSFK